MHTYGLSERLNTFKLIAEGAMAGKSDEELSKEFGMSVFALANIRTSLGVKKRRHMDITLEAKKANINDSGYVSVNFGLDRTQASQLKLENGKPAEFRGKIVDGKLVMTFKNL